MYYPMIFKTKASYELSEIGSVINGRFYGSPFVQVIGIDPAGFLGKKLSEARAFSLISKSVELETSVNEQSDPNRFFIFTCVSGGCEIHANGYCATVAAGDSVFIPATMGEYTIEGKAKLLKYFM